MLDAVPDATTVQANAFTAYLDGVAFGQGDGSQLWNHGDDTGLGALNQRTRFHDGTASGTSSRAFGGAIADGLLGLPEDRLHPQFRDRMTTADLHTAAAHYLFRKN